MRRTIYFVICVTFALGVVVDAAAQEREVTMAQYETALGGGYDKASGRYPRIEEAVHETFEDGKLVTLQKDHYKYAASDLSEHIVETTENGKKRVDIFLLVGTSAYCKIGTKPFKRSRTQCEVFSITSAPRYDKQSFYLKTVIVGGKPMSVYRMYATRSSAPHADGHRTIFYTEQIATINPDGTIAALDRTMGSENDDKEIFSKDTFTYEYDTKIPRIKAPPAARRR